MKISFLCWRYTGLLAFRFHIMTHIIEETWLSYVQLLVRGIRQLPPPVQRDVGIEGLERYYKLLNLYYMWNTVFAWPFDRRWVREERIRTAEKIQYILQHHRKKFRKECAACGKVLAWDFAHYYDFD